MEIAIDVVYDVFLLILVILFVEFVIWIDVVQNRSKNRTKAKAYVFSTAHYDIYVEFTDTWVDPTEIFIHKNETISH